jgi:signal peptidase I
LQVKKEDIIDIFKSVLIGFAIALIITCFVKQVKVVGSSMDDTLHDGQRLLVFRQAYTWGKTPEKDDIVVVNTEQFGESKKIIKRVIATEGQSFEIRGSDVYIDGEKIDEPYIKEEMLPGYDVYIEEIPEGKLFIMGDNRNNSGDSRQIGLVDEDDIYGKVIGY